MSSSNFNAVAFLRALGTLPAEGPRPALLLGIASVTTSISAAIPPTRPLPVLQAGLLGARLDRRYRRIRTIQDELEKLNFDKAKPGAALDDFVFEQTDFSTYKKIVAEDFSLFTDGLDDFHDSFYVKSFGMDRKKIEAVINAAYKRIGVFYYITQEKHLHNPLLMAVMRTLHTSLAFKPLFTEEEVRAEFVDVVRYLTGHKVVDAKTFLPLIEDFNAVYSGLLGSLDGSAVLHDDGMITTFAVEPENNAALTDNKKGPVPEGVTSLVLTSLVLTSLVLTSTFHPRDKAYTIRLV
jgi:hypothetical protein